MTGRLEDLKEWYRLQPKGNLIAAGLIILGMLYVVFGFGYDDEYYAEVNQEMRLAIQICENSTNYVLSEPERLKMGKANLQNITVNGRKIDLKHVAYPKVLFLDSGIRNLVGEKTAQDIYCFFKNPHDSSAQYYFNYQTREWVDKVRFRR